MNPMLIGGIIGGGLGGLSGFFGGASDQMKDLRNVYGNYLHPDNAPNIGVEGTPFGQYQNWLMNSAMGGFKGMGGVGGGGGANWQGFMKKAGSQKFAPEKSAYQKRVARGDYLDVGSNPYVQDRVRIMGDEATRSLEKSRGALLGNLQNAGGTMGMSGMSALAANQMQDRFTQNLANQQSQFLGQQYQAERGLQQQSDATAEQTRSALMGAAGGVAQSQNQKAGMVAQARASALGHRLRGLYSTGQLLGQGHEFNVANQLLPAQMAMQYGGAMMPLEQYLQQHQGGMMGGLQGAMGGFMAGMGAGGMFGGG